MDKMLIGIIIIVLITISIVSMIIIDTYITNKKIEQLKNELYWQQRAEQIHKEYLQKYGLKE